MRPVRFLLDIPKRGLGKLTTLAVTIGKTFRLRDGDGPEVWVENAHHVIQAGQFGIVVGYLFAKGTGRRIARLPGEILHGRDAFGIAEWLTHECWGAYCALLADGPTFHVYADPSGLLPVYCAQDAQHWHCTSDVTLLDVSSFGKPQVSFPALAAHLQRSEWRGTRTCLAGVDELPSGHLTAFGRSATQSVGFWHHSHFMPGRSSGSFAEFARQLRDTAQTVMRAWRSVTGRVLVSASGGVDSSLIAAALGATDRDFACLTVATVDPSGDEREPVQDLARRLGVETFEAWYDASKVDLATSVSLGLPRPTGKAFMKDVRRAAGEAARAFGASAVFDGNGGDNLFCYLHSAVPILDRWRCEGLCRGTAETLLDMCQITQATIPAMLRATKARSRRGSRPSAWPADVRLLASEIGDSSVVAVLEKLAQSIPSHHQGKMDHLELLLRTQNFIHSAADNADPLQLSPLMSQPLVELCLSIPTWIWCQGGINRALARAAFAQDLPSSIVRRVSKAGPDSAMRDIFTHNHALIRDMLLGGLLMSNGLLDAAAIEQALMADPHGADPVIYRLLDLIEAEAWVRSWQGT